MSYNELIMSSQSAGRPFRPKAFSYSLLRVEFIASLLRFVKRAMAVGLVPIFGSRQTLYSYLAYLLCLCRITPDKEKCIQSGCMPCMSADCCGRLSRLLSEDISMLRAHC